MIQNTPPYYEMQGKAVFIRKFLEEGFVIDEKSLRQAIENIKGARGDFVTQEAYDRHLVLYEGALQFLIQHKGE